MPEISVIEIELNGAPHRIDAACTVQSLLTSIPLETQMFAVAVNRQIIPRSSWPQRSLHAHDKVEIVRAIGGG